MPFSTTSLLNTSDTFNTWFNATNNVISYVANSLNFVATTSVTTGNVTLNGSATIYGGLTSNANTYLHGSSASDAVLYVTKATGNANVVTIKSSALDITSGTTTLYGPGTLSIQSATTLSAALNATANIAVSNATSNTVIAPGRIVFNNGNAINATAYSGTANNATFAFGKSESALVVATANNSTFAFGKTEGNLNVNSAVQATNSTNLNSQPGSFYTNASNLSTGTVPVARLGAGTANATTVLLGNNYWADTSTVGVPVGTILMTARATADTGYFLCDGAAISRTTYAALFSAIGSTYGVGNGSTTFNLPDLRQRFPLGKAASGTGSTLGSTGGYIDHDHTTPNHTHTFTSDAAGDHNHSFSGTTSGPDSTYTVNETDPYATVASNAHTHSFSGTTSNEGTHSHTGTTNSGEGGGTTGAGNPPFLVINYQIKY